MSSQNAHSKDNFDFGKPAAKPAPRRVAWLPIVALLAVAGGLMVYSIMPLLAPPATAEVTTLTQGSQSGMALEVSPSYVGGGQDCNVGCGITSFDNPTYTNWGYMTFPLSGRPAGFTRAELILTVINAYNYTWVNVSRVTGSWDRTTLCWDNKPAREDWIACVAISKVFYTTLEDTLNVTVDVTAWVGSGANFSICLSTMYNATRVEFAPCGSCQHIAWTHTVTVAPGFAPYGGIAAAAGVIVVALLSIKQGRKGLTN